MFDDETIAAISAVADDLGIETAALLAVAEVESGGRPFAVVDGRREPMIRFEGHYFDRRLTAEKRALARANKLSSPTAGVIANPKSQAARWQLLARAAKIDANAAYESVSWGLGQVMGAHWSRLGYASVDALVTDVRSGIGGQVRLLSRFLERSNLTQAMQARDWLRFARGYNGPDFARTGYDTKLAAAYARYASFQPRPVQASKASMPRPLAGVIAALATALGLRRPPT